MTEEPFSSGRLLLPDTPPGAVETTAEGFPLSGTIGVVVSVLLFLLVLRSFLSVLPYLSDSILRARGSAALENSVRVSRDRNLVAVVFVIPAILLMFRYRLYDPSFVRELEPDLRLGIIGAVFVGYLVLRFLLYLWARPRRRYDNYQLAYRAGYTFFILLMLLALVTVGILYVLKVPDLIVRTFLLAESGLVYLVYLLRRGQILSLSCNPLTTFLYLCGLELLPTAALVLSAVFL